MNGYVVGEREKARARVAALAPPLLPFGHPLPQGERRGKITTGGPPSPLDPKEICAACSRPSSEHSALRARLGALR